MENKVKTVKMVDLGKENREIEAEVEESVKRVLESGWYILGKEVINFERIFSQYIGVENAVGCASGTDAITLAIKALGIKNGDGIVVPANVYPSSFGVALSGARLQLADIDPSTLNINVSEIKKVVDSTTKAVLVVHLYGNPVDLESISKFCQEKKLFLLEDCAQATGALYKGKKVGSFGDVGCFSFYPTKPLGAIGDGGMITTNNSELAKRLRLWRMYGEEDRYKSVLVGYNSRLDELQAAILATKLQFLERWNAKRQEIAQKYVKGFSELPIEIVSPTSEGEPVYHLFVIRDKNRESLKKFLNENGVFTGIHYPVPIHLTESFSGLGYHKNDFPISEKACNEVLSLPLYPQMEDDEVDYVIDTVRRFYLN